MEARTHIRRAAPPDAGGIARVHVAAWRVAYRSLLPDSTLAGLSIEDTEERWRKRLAEPWGEVLVLIVDGRVAAFVGYGPTQDEGADRETVGEIYVLYVDPDQWQQGHGTALLRAAVDNLRASGRVEVVLWVLHDNERAIAFYKAGGFAADGTTQVKERRDGTRMTVARYRRRL